MYQFHGKLKRNIFPIIYLFLKLQLDSAADYIFQAERASLVYPPPFGRDATPEEAKIMEMDSKTGASLKVKKKS